MSTTLAKKVFELFGKPEVAAEVKQAEQQEPSSFFTDAREEEEEQHPAPPLFPCPSCQGAVRLEPAVSEEHPARIWTCVHCGAWGATRPGAAYPVAWVSSRVMQ